MSKKSVRRPQASKRVRSEQHVESVLKGCRS